MQDYTVHTTSYINLQMGFLRPKTHNWGSRVAAHLQATWLFEHLTRKLDQTYLITVEPVKLFITGQQEGYLVDDVRVVELDGDPRLVPYHVSAVWSVRFTLELGEEDLPVLPRHHTHHAAAH